MNIEEVTEIINEWDPINLLSHAPPDEYKLEIASVMVVLSDTNRIEEVADGIQKIFIYCFGADVFKRSYQECFEIAEKLLKK
ncbi:DUF1871 family protein [Azotosporobacter soli]|uniref:DUF1871 family protein n=1 Tax=Azotosporobacter soli TaxID=3055040 RepID=UPI0031FEB849